MGFTMNKRERAAKERVDAVWPMEFRDIDYRKDTLEKLRRYEIWRLTDLLQALKQETRLCDHIGTSVVKEFRFKGDLPEVIQQLEDLLKKYKTRKFTWRNRMKLIANDIHMLQWGIEKKENPDGLEIQMKMAIRKFDIRKADSLGKAKRKRDLLMHRNRECLCYSNRV
jgi:hypothetical protein